MAAKGSFADGRLGDSGEKDWGGVDGAAPEQEGGEDGAKAGAVLQAGKSSALLWSRGPACPWLIFALPPFPFASPTMSEVRGGVEKIEDDP